MKHLKLFLLLLLAHTAAFAQNGAWTITPYHTLNPDATAAYRLPTPNQVYGSTTNNTPNYPYDAYDGQLATGAANIILNTDETIKFFIVDGVIYDGKGNTIDYLTSMGGQAKGYAEIAVVPDPANCERYYIIAHYVTNYDRFPIVALLDMSESNINAFGPNACNYKGNLITINGTNSNFLQIRNITPNWDANYLGLKNSLAMIAASRLRTDGSRFVFITNNQGIFRYKIDATGFHYDNALIPLAYTAYNHAPMRSEMELISLTNGNYRIALPYCVENVTMNNLPVRQLLYTAELDPNGDLIPNTQKTFPIYYYNPNGIEQTAYIRGLEFSNDGNRLFVTHPVNQLNPNQLEYYEFSGGGSSLSSFNIPNTYDLGRCFIELDAFGWLYFANSTGLYEIPQAESAPPGTIFWVYSFANNGQTHSSSGIGSQEVFLLPDQIDGMDYEEYQRATLQCCLNTSFFNRNTYSAAMNATWTLGNNPFGNANGPVYIKSELRIPAGINVTITNMTLKFAPGARVVIENGTGGAQGGKLTLNNTTLTVDDRCSTEALWLGVEVWGNGTATQGTSTNTTQGRLVLQNNSTISHAEVGVLLSKRNTIVNISQESGCPYPAVVQVANYDNTRDGGIVQATNSNFIGNRRGVYFRPYVASTSANNLSSFGRCDFTWSGNLRDGGIPASQAELFGVKGVKFAGCNFSNTLANMSNPATNGTGITSLYAQFIVTEYCSTMVTLCENCPAPIPSTFNNLRFGVRTYNPDDFTFWVNNSTFNNCQYGMRVQYTKNGTITENQFNIRQATYQTAGISTYFAPSFRIQENHFDGQGSAVGMKSYGVVINNSGTANNDVYKNWFTNLYIGAQSEGVNAVEVTNTNYPGSTNFNMSGLNYTCNDFGSGIQNADMTIANGRIDLFQGHAIGHNSLNEAVAGSARNRFSLAGEGMNPAHDIRVGGTAAQEIFYTGLNSPNFGADSYTPNWVLPLTSSYNGNMAVATTGMCPSLLCPTQQEALLVEHSALRAEIQNIRQSIAPLHPSDPVRMRLEQVSLMREARLELVEVRVISHLLMHENNPNEIRLTLFDLGQQSLWARLNQRWSSQGIQFDDPDLDQADDFLPLDPIGTTNKATIQPQEQSLHVTASPNPTSGTITLTWGTTIQGSIHYTVTDLLGRHLQAGNWTDATQGTIDLASLPEGVYLVQLQAPGHATTTTKVKVQH